MIGVSILRITSILDLHDASLRREVVVLLAAVQTSIELTAFD